MYKIFINNFLLIFFLIFSVSSSFSLVNGDNNVLNNANSVHKNINYGIKSFSSKIELDERASTCDLKMKELVNFKFNEPETKIDYLIVSKRDNYYNFRLNVMKSNNNIEIIESKILSQTNDFFQQKKQKVWLIQVTLNKKIKNIELEFEYYIQNSLKIDNINFKNILTFSIVNPYQFELPNYKLSISILSNNLEYSSINLPNDSMYKTITKNGIDIIYRKNIPSQTAFDIILPIPQIINSCDMILNYTVDFMVYGLFSFIFLLMLIIFIFAFKYNI